MSSVCYAVLGKDMPTFLQQLFGELECPDGALGWVGSAGDPGQHHSCPGGVVQWSTEQFCPSKI